MSFPRIRVEAQVAVPPVDRLALKRGGARRRAVGVRRVARMVARATREWLGPPGIVFLLAVVALCALRVPFLPPSLEDIDSVNFDLGVHDFDPPAHRPHPPGYPLFIGAAKIVHAFYAAHAGALALVSAVFGALAVIPLYLLMRQVTSAAGAALACVFTVFCPLVWFNSVRPMSDTTGFFFVTLAQWAIVAALRHGRVPGATRLPVAVAGLLAGLAMGVRAQAVVLVLPVFTLLLIRRRDAWGRAVLGGFAGILVWLVPLVLVSGGPMPLVRSFITLVNDALPDEPLLAAFTTAAAAKALRNTFVAPWVTPLFAQGLLSAAVVGVVALGLRAPRSLALALLLYLPYTVYHVFMQMTDTIRYAIPIVPLIALAASTAVDRLGGLALGSKTSLAVTVAILGGLQTYPALAAYHRELSPQAQAIAFMAEQHAADDQVVASGHHVFARYLPWLPQEMAVIAPQPRAILRLLGQYWLEGRRDDVLFLRDPTRTTFHFFAPGSVESMGRWHWPSAVVPFMRGERPGEIELVRLRAPEWFSGGGLMLSAEAGRPEQVAREPHVLYVRSRPIPRILSVSGTLPDRPSATISLRVGTAIQDERTVGRRFTAETPLEPRPQDEYVPVRVEASGAVLVTHVLVRRPGDVALQLADGFDLPEQDEGRATYRWMGPKATALVYMPRPGGRLTLRGRVPIEHYDLPVTLSLRWNDEPVASFTLHETHFSIEHAFDAVVPSGWNRLELESSHHFVADEREGTDDRRRLALRVYDLAVVGNDAAPAHTASTEAPAERSRGERSVPP
jgi:hypothetical protein